jgi:Ca2+-binding RTX toxin-like protein
MRASSHPRRFRRGATAAALAAGALAAALPGTALASFASVGPISQPGAGNASAPSLLVSGAGNGIGGGSIDEPNDIRIQDVAGVANTFIVTDTASPLRAANNCVQLDAHRVRCTGANVGDTRFYAVFAFGGNDRIQIDSTYLSRGGKVSAGTGSDVLLGGIGADFLSGDEGNDVLRGGRGADRLDGGAGIDVATYADRTTSVRVSIDNSANDGQQDERDNVLTTVENVVGGAAGDTLIGSAGSNVLNGNGGNDFLNGLGGADVLLGSLGNDFLVANDGIRDSVSCGDGSDSALVDGQDVRAACESVTVR